MDDTLQDSHYLFGGLSAANCADDSVEEDDRPMSGSLAYAQMGNSSQDTLEEALRSLGPVPCAHPDGPTRCYCARGTTKPLAQVNHSGEIVATFCGGRAAQAHFKMGHEIYQYIPSGARQGQDLPGNNGRLIFIPDGVCANVGIFRVSGERVPRAPKTVLTEEELEARNEQDAARRAAMLAELSDPGMKRKSKPVDRLQLNELGGGDDYGSTKRHKDKALWAVDSGDGAVRRARPANSMEQPLNPFCTSGRENCYCRSGENSTPNDFSPLKI
jgi:hypothetical protein